MSLEIKTLRAVKQVLEREVAENKLDLHDGSEEYSFGLCSIIFSLYGRKTISLEQYKAFKALIKSKDDVQYDYWDFFGFPTNTKGQFLWKPRDAESRLKFLDAEILKLSNMELKSIKIKLSKLSTILSNSNEKTFEYKEYLETLEELRQVKLDSITYADRVELGEMDFILLESIIEGGRLAERRVLKSRIKYY